MTRKLLSYSADCADLALSFLEDSEWLAQTDDNVATLAQHIQDAIEEWLNERETQAQIDAGDIEPVLAP